jgi:putative transposase
MSPAKGRLWVYNGGMVLRRTPHAVYDTLYHLVWSPKYRRDVLQGEVQQRVQELFADIAEQYDITIEEMEVSPDHVHIFCSFPPRYSIAQVVTRFKSLSARAIFREFPRIKRRLWGGELWEDSYFARTVGDKVTAEVIRRYIQQHRLEESGDTQLSDFSVVLFRPNFMLVSEECPMKTPKNQ